MPRDIPVIMSKPMVQGLLQEAREIGTGKSETRRLAWKPPHLTEYDFASEQLEEFDVKGWNVEHRGQNMEVSKPSPWQFVQPGDRLWVRENLAVVSNWGIFHDASEAPPAGKFLDDLDERGMPLLQKYGDHYNASDRKLIPSIHMPRWASRLTLVVTHAKVERLHEITEAGAEREGVVFETADPPFVYVPGIECAITAVGVEEKHDRPIEVVSYSKLWNHLHGAGAWERNPEVVALQFHVHLRNVDAMEKAA